VYNPKLPDGEFRSLIYMQLGERKQSVMTVGGLCDDLGFCTCLAVWRHGHSIVNDGVDGEAKRRWMGGA